LYFCQNPAPNSGQQNNIKAQNRMKITASDRRSLVRNRMAGLPGITHGRELNG
jgi:hypothetical protein